MAATTVALRFKNATLWAEIDPADVDSMLRNLDGVATADKDRGGAMSWVLGAVRRNRHLTGEGEKVAMTVLWFMCRHPAIGPTAATLAREGGGILAYEVTRNPASVRRTQGDYNWRTYVGTRALVAPHVPWLPPADMPTAGSA
jgi:hypothetical protein